MNTDALFSAIGIGIPNLPGARCRGKWNVFDETECPETIEFAINQCRSCPALARCAQWFDSLPRTKRPSGVAAAQVWVDGKPKAVTGNKP